VLEPTDRVLFVDAPGTPPTHSSTKVGNHTLVAKKMSPLHPRRRMPETEYKYFSTGTTSSYNRDVLLSCSFFGPSAGSYLVSWHANTLDPDARGWLYVYHGENKRRSI
jgi:hypothetical protein